MLQCVVVRSKSSRGPFDRLAGATLERAPARAVGENSRPGAGYE